MALVADAVWTIVLSFRDNDSNSATMTMYFPGSESAANVQTAITGTLIPAVQGITDAVVTGYRYSYGAKETDPLVLDAPETSDVERKASFVFRDEGLGTMKLEIPSVDNTLVIDGTQNLDPANPLVAAFINAIIDTGVADLGNFVTFRNLALIERLGGVRKIHRGSQKG